MQYRSPNSEGLIPNLRTFVWRVSAALVVLFALASGAAYYNTAYRWRAYTPFVDAFLKAGVHADTAALRRAAIDSTPVIQILATAPVTLERLRQSMRIRWGMRRADTVVIDYATRETGCYQTRLVRKAGSWLVARAAVEPC